MLRGKCLSMCDGLYRYSVYLSLDIEAHRIETISHIRRKKLFIQGQGSLKFIFSSCLVVASDQLLLDGVHGHKGVVAVHPVQVADGDCWEVNLRLRLDICAGDHGILKIFNDNFIDSVNSEVCKDGEDEAPYQTP